MGFHKPRLGGTKLVSTQVPAPMYRIRRQEKDRKSPARAPPFPAPSAGACTCLVTWMRGVAAPPGREYNCLPM
jgi:hypothetical protein